MKTKHGVFLKYGKTEIPLNANELELIGDALLIIWPDTKEQSDLAKKLAKSFLSLCEYSEWVESHNFPVTR